MEYIPECRKCRHHSRLIGNNHIACKNPAIQSLHNLPYAKIATIIGGFEPIIPTIELNGEAIPVVQFNEHGIRKGWASWPYNFDPIWIQFCIFWTAEKMQEETQQAKNNGHKEANDAKSNLC